MIILQHNILKGLNDENYSETFRASTKEELKNDLVQYFKEYEIEDEEMDEFLTSYTTQETEYVLAGLAVLGKTYLITLNEALDFETSNEECIHYTDDYKLKKEILEYKYNETEKMSIDIDWDIYREELEKFVEPTQDEVNQIVLEFIEDDIEEYKENGWDIQYVEETLRYYMTTDNTFNYLTITFIVVK